MGVAVCKAMAPGNSQAEVPVPAPMLTAPLIWARQRGALTLPPVSPPDGVTLQLSNRPQHLAAVRFHLACVGGAAAAAAQTGGAFCQAAALVSGPIAYE